MFLSRLQLEHFRNYRELDLAFNAPVTLLQGRNGQGKTNLLEAVYYLATSKSRHARTEREVVDRAAAEEPIPYARIRGDVVRAEQSTMLEILFTLRNDGFNYTKLVRVNGAPRRSMDLIGHLRAVLFLPQDLTLIAGSPGERRRYIDIALCQIDRRYCQALSSYQKVVTQRNSLLKQLQEQAQADSPSVAAQLSFWDDQLIEQGTRVLSRRHTYLTHLAPIARRVHADLSQEQEALDLLYLPSFNTGLYTDQDYQRLREGEEVGADDLAGVETDTATISPALPRAAGKPPPGGVGRRQFALRAAPGRTDLPGERLEPACLRQPRAAAHRRAGSEAGGTARDVRGDRREADPAAGRRDERVGPRSGGRPCSARWRMCGRAS